MKPNLNLTQLTKDNYARAGKVRDDVEPHFSDLSDAQIIGIYNASDMVGEYIDGLNKYDLATFTSAEWLTMLRVAALSYHDTLTLDSELLRE